MLELLIDFLRILTTPDRLIHLLGTVFTGWWGYLLLCGVVFSETGLLVGFFLPGDSFLFTVGVVAGAGKLDIVTIILLLLASAIVGNSTGYLLGRKAGTAVFNRPDSRFFHRDHLIKTQAFYDKHGGKTIIFAQFIPILRTFAPFVAGVARMSYLRFMSFNVFGAIAWVISMTLLGYTLGNQPFVRAHFEKVVLAII
ncbi:MAG: VTT domain-containing protein, partial [Bryobacteraceae bacterium]|nr:VTT domain-containing protein [Bryobacteraceae bacterium]